MRKRKLPFVRHIAHTSPRPAPHTHQQLSTMDLDLVLSQPHSHLTCTNSPFCSARHLTGSLGVTSRIGRAVGIRQTHSHGEFLTGARTYTPTLVTIHKTPTHARSSIHISASCFPRLSLWGITGSNVARHMFNSSNGLFTVNSFVKKIEAGFLFKTVLVDIDIMAFKLKQKNAQSSCIEGIDIVFLFCFERAFLSHLNFLSCLACCKI